MVSRTCLSSLTEDILVEIFTYLPLTSIYKFKCISKVWLSNLSDPNFITKWFKINNKSLPWIQYHTITSHFADLKFRDAFHSHLISRSHVGFSFEFLRNQKQFQGAKLYLLGSSNGLVLGCSVHSDDQRRFYVCNPLTQKWVTLPSPPLRSEANYPKFSAIFCENSLSTSCRYKVVRIPKCTSLKLFKIDMFSSDLGEWRSFQVSCGKDVLGFKSRYENVVTLNGDLYWLEGSDKMMVYNLNQNNTRHQCSLIKLPGPRFIEYESHNKFDDLLGDELDARFVTRTLGESEGWICFAELRVTGRQFTVSVWVLDKDHWLMLHKDILVHDTLAEICFSLCDNGSGRVQLLGFSPVDRNVVLLGCKHRVWWFNIQTRSFEELGHSSLLIYRGIDDTGEMIEPFVLKAMPTILPPASWMDI